MAVVRAAAETGTPVRVLATGHGVPIPVTDGILVTTSRLTGVSCRPGREGGAHQRGLCLGRCRHGRCRARARPDHRRVRRGRLHRLHARRWPRARWRGPTASRPTGRAASAWSPRSGEVVTATATEHPDLFWALRGGKGGFGIVTSMDFGLVELTTLYGGSVFFDAEHIAPVLTAWADWTNDVARGSELVGRDPPAAAARVHPRTAARQDRSQRPLRLRRRCGRGQATVPADPGRRYDADRRGRRDAGQ